jgi:hypothetical protein
VPELARVGLAPAQRDTVHHDAAADPAAHVERRERPPRADACHPVLADRRGGRVVLHQDRQADRLGQTLVEVIAAPAAQVRGSVLATAAVAARARPHQADAEAAGPVHAGAVDQHVHVRDQAVEELVAAGARGSRPGHPGDHAAGLAGEHIGRRVLVEVDADRDPGRRVEPQHRAGLAAGGGAAGLDDQALLEQPADRHGHRGLGQAGHRGEFHAAELLGRPDRVEDALAGADTPAAPAQRERITHVCHRPSPRTLRKPYCIDDFVQLLKNVGERPLTTPYDGTAIDDQR